MCENTVSHHGVDLAAPVVVKYRQSQKVCTSVYQKKKRVCTSVTHNLVAQTILHRRSFERSGMKSESPGPSLRQTLLGLSKANTLCPMKSIVYISATAVTVFMVLPHETVGGRPVPTLFRNRPTDYHMFLICTLFAFMGAFSALFIQDKPRVEKFCRIYAMVSMLSALAIVLYAAALWFVGPLLK